MMKRSSVLLLVVLCMFVVVMGCSNNENASNSSEGGEDNRAAPVQTVEEPVILKIWTTNLAAGFQPGFQDDEVMKYIEEKFNVRLEITPANASADYSAKFNTALAGGDLPDMAAINDVGGDIKPKLISAKAILPLEELVEQYGPDIKNNAKMIERTKRENNGQLYFIGLNSGLVESNYQPNQSIFLRYDVWRKAGYPKAETLDDYIVALQNMMEVEPTDAAGNKTYGLSGWFGENWGIANIEVPFQFFTGTWNLGYSSYNWDSREIVSKFGDPNSFYYQGLRWWNKAYRAGVLDPASFTMKFDDYREKVNSGRIFMDFFFAYAEANTGFRDAGMDDKGFVVMPPLSNVPKYAVQLPADGRFFYFISSNSKHPEKAMELLNFFTSYEGNRLLYNGIEGVHWDVVDGKPAYKEEVLQKLLAGDKEFQNESGIGKYADLGGYGPPHIDPTFDLPVYFMEHPQYLALRNTSELQKEANEHFGVEYPGEMYKDRRYTAHEMSMASYYKPLEGDNLVAWGNINSYIEANYIKLVRAESEAEFDRLLTEFIDTIKRMGIDAMDEWAGEFAKTGKEALGL